MSYTCRILVNNSCQRLGLCGWCRRRRRESELHTATLHRMCTWNIFIGWSWRYLKSSLQEAYLNYTIWRRKDFFFSVTNRLNMKVPLQCTCYVLVILWKRKIRESTSRSADRHLSNLCFWGESESRKIFGSYNNKNRLTVTVKDKSLSGNPYVFR